jgi:UDP-glucose 4-epimerase
MKWVVTGGAGYIGSHTVRELLKVSDEVLVIDDLSTGIRSRLPSECPFEILDLRDTQLVRTVLDKYQPEGIMHFAAKKQARESLRFPWTYWSVNIGSLLGLLSAIQGTSIRHIVHSSSCSIYGSSGLVNEKSPINPESTYGWTKAISEQILKAFSSENSLAVTSLRYFNVIGCGDFENAMDSSTECLVPATFDRIQSKQPLQIYGNDFETPDGTALRDYIDVRDLATAHIQAVINPPTQGEFRAINVSGGNPISVSDILNIILKITSLPHYPIEVSSRKEGDPDIIWSRPSHIMSEWGWGAKHSVYESIFAHYRSWLSKTKSKNVS